MSDIEKPQRAFPNFTKNEGIKLETPEEMNAYIAGAEEILGKYPEDEGRQTA